MKFCHYSNPRIICEFLTPEPSGFGEGWGGLKNLRLLQGLLYICGVLRSSIGIARVKQTLHWTVPKLITPEQSQRSIDLMPLLTWQLWLAKDLGAGNSSPQALIPL